MGNAFLILMSCLAVHSYGLFASISTPFANDIDAVIFDCDGVLVDTEYLKFLSWQQALASVGIELSIEEYKQVVGHSSKKILAMLKKMKELTIPDNVIPLKRLKYEEMQKQGVPQIKQAVEFARQLSMNKGLLGIQLGLASSAARSEILVNLKQIGLEQAFDLIISGSDDLDSYADDNGKNKPKPYIYLEAAKRLQVSPEHCLVFEDTSAGVDAASNAGMIAIAIPNQITEKQDFSNATAVRLSISDVGEIRRSETQSKTSYISSNMER